MNQMKWPPLRGKLMRIGLFCILSMSLISWDKVSKELARTRLKDQPMRSYLGDSFRLAYVENTGAAMSLGDDLNPTVSFWLLGVLPLTILVGLFGYVVTHAQELPVRRMVAFSLIFAGGMGNILDRMVFDRHVTDFMNIGLWNIRTGIFNFADVWIVAGVICLLIYRGGGLLKTDQLTNSTGANA